MPISHFNDFKLGLKCNNFKHFKQFGLSTLRMLCPPIRRAAGSTLRDARCAVAVAVGQKFGKRPLLIFLLKLPLYSNK